MPKHKKFLKSEKAKIKLKGAKLPKGLNVTKTDFKVKKIVIREQLKDAFNEDGTVIRKQNVKELLTKLQHHNPTYRNEGLRYLKDILLHHPDETKKQFGNIIKGIAPMALDMERDVRKECFKAMNILLSTTTPDTMLPFFDILVSYLKCAMTHIQFAIQEDSLFLMDSLLQYLPSLVAVNGDAIFSSFLDMISKLRSESKPGRTLSTNLNSKVTSVKWRTKVLDRLLGLLRVKVMAKRNAIKAQTKSIPNAVACEMAVEDAFTLEPTSVNRAKSQTANVHYYDASTPMCFSVVQSHLNRNCLLPSLFRKQIANGATTNNTQTMFGVDEEKLMQHYTETLIPLMFETWMEVRPHLDSDFEAKSCLSNEAAHTLKIILEIFEKLYELIGIWCADNNSDSLLDWFTATYNKEFCAQFMDAFPYVQNEGFRGSKKKSKGVPTEMEVSQSGGQKCYLQNLKLGYLFGVMNGNLTKSTLIFAEKIIDYLLNNLSAIVKASTELSTPLIVVLREILYRNGSSWIRSPNCRLNDLLAKTLDYYQTSKFSKDIRNRIQILLCDIVLDDKQLAKAYGEEKFHSWLNDLPSMLCSTHISQHILQTFSCLGRQQNNVFLRSFKQKSPQFIDNIAKIQVNGAENEIEGRHSIVNLFFWIDVDAEMENVLQNRKDDVSVHICQVLKLRKHAKQMYSR